MVKKIIFLCITTLLLLQSLLADSWQIQPGQARDIAVGANGQIWIITNTPTSGGFTIATWNAGRWETIDGGGVRIAVDIKGNPWVINDAGAIWHRVSNRWYMIPDVLANDIAAGANESIWVISKEPAAGGFKVKEYARPSSGNREVMTWRSINESGGVRITVAPNGAPFVVNNTGQIFEWENGRWVSYPGIANDIAIGTNGKIWVVGVGPRPGGFGLFSWNGNDWIEDEGAATNIAVDPNGRPWVTNSLFQIHRRIYSAPSYRRSPTVTPISMSYPMAGRISAIGIDPTNNNHIIVAGETGGLFETMNAGSNTRTWLHLTGFKHHSVTDILITNVPGGQEIWVTTTGNYDNNNITPLIWKRNTDGLWSKAVFPRTVSLTASATEAFRLVKDKRNSTLFAIGIFGLAVKDAGTDTWVLRNSPTLGEIISIETMSNGALIAACTNGFFYSETNGSSWEMCTTTTPLPSFSNRIVQRFALKADVTGTVVFASKMRDNTGIDLFTSTNNGRGWNQVPGIGGRNRVSGFAVGGLESVLPVFNSSARRLDVFVSNAENIHYATSSGNTIIDAVSNMTSGAGSWLPGTGFNSNYGFNWGHEDTRQVAILSTGLTTPKMILTSDGGFHFADITGANPEIFSFNTENTSSGLNAVQMFNFTGTNREFYFGTMDNGFGYNADGTLSTWVMGGGREGYMIEKRGAGLYDGVTIMGINNIFSKITNGFDLVNDCPPVGSSDRTLWNSPVPGYSNPANLTKGVYFQNSNARNSYGYPWKISFNRGCSWTDIGVSTFERAGGEKYFFSQKPEGPLTLVTCFNKSGITVLGSLSDILQRSDAKYWTDAFMSGIEVGIAVAGKDFLFNPIYAVNPENPLFVLAMDASGKLKKSSSGGGIWEEVSTFSRLYEDAGRYSFKSSDGSYSIWNIEFSPYDPQFILVGTVSRGLFYSRDGGNSWSRMMDNGVFMPTDFHWKSATEVIVATYGRGLFRIRL